MTQGATVSSARQKPPPAPASRGRKGIKVLVVDDEVDFLVATVEMFKVMGYDTVAARTGEEALAVMRGHLDLSVLITEVDMEPMDGVTLARKARTFIPGIKVVLVSAFPTSTMDLCHGSPDEDFHLLLKPLQLSEVAIVLRR